MTREEARYLLNNLRSVAEGKEDEAIDMAIEALQEPKTIIGIDIPYGSDKGIATIFKNKNEKLILEEVKEIMSVVRCKDCIYGSEDYPKDIFPDATDETYSCDHSTYSHDKDFYCKYGERENNHECK